MEIPSSVTSIGSYAFAYCEYLSSLTFDENSQLSSIGDRAFRDCSSLNEVKGFDKLTKLTNLDISLFYECTSLESFVIPKCVETIDKWAFYGCTGLKEIYSLNATPAKCNDNYIFDYVPSDCVLYVPAGAEKNYGDYSSSYSDDWSSLSTVRTFHLLDVVAKADAGVEGNEDGYGYMTYYNGEYTYTLPEGMTATTVSGVDDDGNLIMDWEYNGDDPDKAEVPANTAVVIYGKVDEFMAMVDYTDDTSTKYGTIADGTAPETNWLHGVWSTDDLYSDNNYTSVVFAYDDNNEKTVDNYLFYTLNYDSIDEETGVYKDIGFYWSAEDGGPFTLAAKKAWLAIPTDTANEAKFTAFLFGENGETTGIKAINNTSSDDARTGDGYIYNLAGQRVNNASQRGIYIINGKKVVKGK